MKYIRSVWTLLSFTLCLLLSQGVSFSYSDICIDRGLRQNAYGIEELPTNTYSGPKIIFADYTTFEDILCPENKYSLIVRPDDNGFQWALDMFGYTRDDYIDDPDSVMQKVNHHMLFEYSNCGYIQLMPTNASISEYFSGRSFLERHSQAPQDGDFVDFYRNFDSNNTGINTSWRYMLVDMTGKVLKWGQNFNEIEEVIFKPYCRDYNCNGNPDIEKDVDNDSLSNDHIDEQDIDGDGLLDVDHRLEFDTDGDGIPNTVDLDIDCDGKWNGSLEENDMDGDGENDKEDEDEDGDGEDNENDTGGSCGCGGGGSKDGGSSGGENGGDNSTDEGDLGEPGGSEGENNGESNGSETSGEGDIGAGNAGVNTSGTSSAGNTTSGTSSAGNTTSGTSSAGNTTSGTSSAGNTTSGTSSAGNTTSGTSSAGNSNSGNAGRLGDLRVEIPYSDGFQDIIADDSVITPNDANNSFTKFVQLINTYLWIALLIVFMLMLIYAGFTLFTSFGEEEKFKKGNKILLYVVIGLVVAVVSYALINIVVNLF